METNVTTTGALVEVLGLELEELVLGAELDELALGAELEELLLSLLVLELLLDVLGTSLLVVLGAGSELLLSLLLWVCVPQATNIEVASNNVSNFLTFIKMPPLKNW